MSVPAARQRWRGAGVESQRPSPNCCSFAFLFTFSRALLPSPLTLLILALRRVRSPARGGRTLRCPGSCGSRARISSLLMLKLRDGTASG